VTLTNYSDRQSPQFRILSEGQCQELYLATLECLNRIGVLVHHQPAIDLLAAAGATVNGERVYIPPHIIQEALVTTPRTFTLWGRERQHELRISHDRVYFGPGPTCTYFYDPQTGERRKSRRGDAGMAARVADALPNIDFVMSLSLYDDVIPVLSPVYEFADMIANTGKPIVAWANDLDTLKDIHQIASTVVGGEDLLRRKPTFAYFASYESPLRHGEKQIANLIWAARQGLPIVYLGGPNVGMESPVTGASALVVYLAAALSGLAIVQLAQRGAPMMIGSVPSAMDLRNARPAYGSPEMSLHAAAAADIGRYLGVPFMGTAGTSESKLLDAQAAVEATLQILMAGLSGAGMVHDVGFMDCADIGSLQMLVMSDEIISMVRRILRGMEVNQQTIMLDLIEKVGPGMYFISEPKSSALCRSEIWNPKLLDRNPYTTWKKQGGKDMLQRVNESLQKILETHEPPALPAGAEEKINLILKQAERRSAPN
jgi:trimethylamine--corrinoid protein Co-methyltransferase